MNEFKLIALRPLEGCDKNYKKILHENETYVFYNEYDFSRYNTKRREISIKKIHSPDLYSFTNGLKKEIKLNISAIVGQNGSGKSSLVELFYVSCYNISVINHVLYDEEDQRLLGADDIVKDINIEIFYQLNNNVYMINMIGNKIRNYVLQDNIFMISKDKFKLDSFFYTVAINYSLHSLNSEVLGNWVRKIFHKNDGYQTPIVLNPYRHKGIIDINNEEYLVKSRLISNILGRIDSRVKPEETLRNILDSKTAYRLRVEINRDKFQYENSKPIFPITETIGKTILPLVYKYFLKDENFEPKNTLLNRYAKEYILYKLQSICSKYQPYKKLFRSFTDNIGQANDYLRMLSEENSHVTLKLIQAINFLRNELYFDRKESFDLTVAYLSTQLDKQIKTKDQKLIDILPPAFFKVDIEFKDSDSFSHLSSGEKQRVYSLATLIYHINNLSSTNAKIVNNKYNNVNVIFDELELYFHPELQRNLINDIIENVKKINLNEINSINILLITHSPFILSDIPNENILFLSNLGAADQTPRNTKTFGGNIHELLGNSFFLRNGFVGEYAKNRIQGIIDILIDSDNKKKSKLDKNSIWNEIQIIGEPFLKQKIEEMFYLKFDKELKISELREEIKRLENG
ncbi:AAA family ATPase [Chryseobacterium geocarposphaerae]|uniref:Putative AbiEii toxin of type IV toxin-antitoxin system n=1 Tax=Chryseobacterium geocarposphaerae TaxID=1416776 RepID=A0A2M9C922_9FLAO|nr:AAA family ATPase [Chryseobacterium geocarposphaerae]PJJ67341.1 putative AbiEii toxin of type IV toxin-antitoxin system [Chryseobacterium geocarposphaerae]